MPQFLDYIKKILGKLIEGKVKNSPPSILDFITFDDSEYHYQGNQNGVHIWHMPGEDGIMNLQFFNIPPDIPSGKRTIEKLKDAALQQASFPSKFLVEYKIIHLDGIPSVKQIIKIPQEPFGMTYRGSFIIPFQDFSFVLKVEYPELGMTGEREAILLLELGSEGKVSEDFKTGKITGDWNPDAEKYDKDFPDHPISRLRTTLIHLEKSVVLNAEVKNKPRFTLPEK